MAGPILVTGALGFLGSKLARALVDRGRQVIAPIRLGSLDQNNQSLYESKNLRYWEIPEDDSGQVLEAVPRAEVLVHAATSFGRDKNSLRRVIDSNLVFPLALLDSSMQSGLRLFINIDSYFNKPGQEFSSLLNYSLTKRSLLSWLEHFAAKVDVVNLRLEHVYGPGDREEKFIPEVIRKIAKEQVHHFDLTSGIQLRDFIYVDDVVDAILVTIEAKEKLLKNSKGQAVGNGHLQTFEVGTGISTSIATLVETVASRSKSSTLLRFGALPSPKDEVMTSKSDMRFQKTFGWEHKTHLENGLKALIEAD